MVAVESPAVVVVPAPVKIAVAVGSVLNLSVVSFRQLRNSAAVVVYSWGYKVAYKFQRNELLSVFPDVAVSLGHLAAMVVVVEAMVVVVEVAVAVVVDTAADIVVPNLVADNYKFLCKRMTERNIHPSS